MCDPLGPLSFCSLRYRTLCIATGCIFTERWWKWKRLSGNTSIWDGGRFVRWKWGYGWNLGILPYWQFIQLHINEIQMLQTLSNCLQGMLMWCFEARNRRKRQRRMCLRNWKTTTLMRANCWNMVQITVSRWNSQKKNDYPHSDTCVGDGKHYSTFLSFLRLGIFSLKQWIVWEIILYLMILNITLFAFSQFNLNGGQ
jgi:hypothetical protein